MTGTGYGAPLSARELEILRRVSSGQSNAQIGRDLFLAENTVKTHLRRAMIKLGAKDRAHAVALGFEAGLLASSALRLAAVVRPVLLAIPPCRTHPAEPAPEACRACAWWAAAQELATETALLTGAGGRG